LGLSSSYPQLSSSASTLLLEQVMPDLVIETSDLVCENESETSDLVLKKKKKKLITTL